MDLQSCHAPFPRHYYYLLYESKINGSGVVASILICFKSVSHLVNGMFSEINGNQTSKIYLITDCILLNGLRFTVKMLLLLEI